MKTAIDKTLKDLQAKLERTKKAADAYEKIATILKQAGFGTFAELETFLTSVGSSVDAPTAKAGKAVKLRVVAPVKPAAPKKAAAKPAAAKPAGEKQKRVRLTSEQKDTIFTLRTQGKSPTEIAEATKIPYPTVYQTIRRQEQAKAA